MSSFYQKAHFLLSAAQLSQLPPDQGIEIAMVGRSNAGKSSVLNAITHNKQLARVSKTPGRTQLINIFVLDEKRRLIDLPGYGFAKVPIGTKLKWQQLMAAYLKERQSLQGLILVMDIRHPLQTQDVELLDFCQHEGLAVHILLNKCDKISRSACAVTAKQVSAFLTQYSNSVTLQTFSALKKQGMKELTQQLDQWFHI